RGVLSTYTGASLALGSHPLYYLVSALTLSGVRDQTTSKAQTTKTARSTLRSLWQEMIQGARFIIATPQQRLLKAVSIPIQLDSGAIELLLVALTLLRLHLLPWQAGLVFGAAGAGG